MPGSYSYYCHVEQSFRSKAVNDKIQYINECFNILILNYHFRSCNGIPENTIHLAIRAPSRDSPWPISASTTRCSIRRLPDILSWILTYPKLKPSRMTPSGIQTSRNLRLQFQDNNELPSNHYSSCWLQTHRHTIRQSSPHRTPRSCSHLATQSHLSMELCCSAEVYRTFGPRRTVSTYAALRYSRNL